MNDDVKIAQDMDLAIGIIHRVAYYQMEVANELTS